MPSGSASTSCAKRARVAHRHLGRHPAAEAGAHQHRVLQLQLLGEIEIQIGQIIDRAEPVRQRRAAEARMKRRDDPMRLAERVEPRPLGRTALRRHAGTAAAGPLPSPQSRDRRPRLRLSSACTRSCPTFLLASFLGQQRIPVARRPHNRNSCCAPSPVLQSTITVRRDGTRRKHAMPMESRAAQFRKLLASGKMIVAPGVYRLHHRRG